MLFKSIIIGLIAVFAKIDSRMLGRLNFERPLISCTLVGLFLGDVTTGLAVGASMEMVSLGFMSIGASGFDMNMGSIAGCALVIMTGSNIETALAIATPMTLLITLIETGANVVRISMAHMIDGYVDKGEFKKAKRMDIFWGPMLYAVCTFIPVFMAVYLGSDAINAIVHAVPEFILNGITLGANLVAFFGFAMVPISVTCCRLARLQSNCKAIFGGQENEENKTIPASQRRISGVERSFAGRQYIRMVYR